MNLEKGEPYLVHSFEGFRFIALVPVVRQHTMARCHLTAETQNKKEKETRSQSSLQRHSPSASNLYQVPPLRFYSSE
jgi:hypothetical protein